MQIRRSPGLVLGALFLALALTGTAVGAKLITSKQIKNGTIKKKDISKKARAALRGETGPQGAQGVQGLPGERGQQGPPGPTVALQAFTTELAGPLSTDSGAPDELAALDLPGPGAYLVQAGGSLFAEAPDSGNPTCSISAELLADDRRYQGPAHGSAAEPSDAQYEEGSFALTRLIEVPPGADRLRLVAHRVYGGASCFPFAVALTAMPVSDATGAQEPLLGTVAAARR